MEEFQKNVTIYLNQISKDNVFIIIPKLNNSIGKIKEDHEQYYGIFIEILFNKAVSEKLFIEIYCDVCHKISKYILAQQKELFLLFYRNLINKCQKVFETDIDDSNIDKIKGCATLIAQLINKGLIQNNLVNIMISKLLSYNDENKIEILITLINSLEQKIKIDKEVIDKIGSISDNDYSSMRIGILLSDIVERYK